MQRSRSVGPQPSEVDNHDAVALLPAFGRRASAVIRCMFVRNLRLLALELAFPERLPRRGLACLFGGFAVPDATLGLPVGEDPAEIAMDRVGLHPQ
jgi:hypothetical protein